MKRTFIPISLVPLLLVFALSAPAADLVLNAPREVGRGDAFHASAQVLSDDDSVVFFWRGRQYPVQAELLPGTDGKWAEIILPVPLDEMSGALDLAVGTIQSGKPMQEVRAKIALLDRDRPVQKLTVDAKYVNPPASEQQRIKRDAEKVAEALSHSYPVSSWRLPFLRPVSGQVTSQFGMKRVFNGEPRSVHKGLDLRGASGTPAHAVADGRVALVDNLYFSGNTVYVDHGGGVFSAYLHLSEPKVKPGDIVSRGDLIGLVGATGRVTGPHLHLSLIVQGTSVDPESLLEPGKWQ